MTDAALPIGAPTIRPPVDVHDSRADVDPTEWGWLRELVWFVALLLGLVAARTILPGTDTVPSIGIMSFGVVVGGLSALMAVAIILIYRTNKIINFALAGIGVFGAVFFQQLASERGWPYFVALGVGVLLSATLAGVIEYVFVRRFFKAPRLILTVATIGISQLVLYLTLVVPSWATGGDLGASATLKSPFYTTQQEIAGFIFRGDAFVALAALPIVVVLLNMFFRTRFGTAARAAAENSDRAGLLGVPVKRVSTVVWVIAGALVGVAASLQVPLLGVPVAGGGSGFMLRALAAAVIAKMENLKVAVMAALALGVIEQTVFAAYAGSTATDAILLGVIVVALLVQHQTASRAETETSSWTAVEEVKPVPAELRDLPIVKIARWVLGAVLVVGLVGLPPFVGDTTEYQLQTVIVYAMVAVSLVVLTGWSGQISLGQFAIVGFGAAVCSKLLVDLGWDLLLAMLAGTIAGGAVSMLLGLVALRVTGFFFAVTTLGFAVAVPSFFLNRRYFSWLVLDEFARVERPMLLERFDLTQESTFYWFSLLLLGLVIVTVRSLRASRVGRVLIAVRDNEKAAQSYGISQAKAKLMTFAISGMIAGLAGALYTIQQQVDPGSSANAYAPAASLQVFSMVVIGGLGSIPGALLGAVYVRWAILNLSAQIALLATGAGLLFMLLIIPGGLGRVLYSIRDAALRWYADRKGILVPSLLADRREAELQTAAVERDVEQAMQRIAEEKLAMQGASS